MNASDDRASRAAGFCGLVASLFAALLWSAMAIADDPPGVYSFRNFGPEQGLGNQAVTSLAQDAAGFIFVGTEDGLFRYDGERFLRFGTGDGLPSDSVTVLHATRRGQLWVATQKGMLPWNVSAPAESAGKPLLPGHEVLGIASSDSGHLLVSTTTGSFEGDSNAMAPLKNLPTQAGAGWLSADGSEMLVATAGSLYLRDAQLHWHIRKLPQAAAESAQAVLRDRRGRIWIRGRQMLLRLRSFDADIEDLGKQLPGAAVQKGELHEDASGRIWAPTNRGVVFFNGDRRELVDAARGLPHEWATTVMVDREGNPWIASEGVQRLLGRLAWTAFTTRQGLPSDTVWAIHRDRSGTLWAATNRGVAEAGASGWTALPDLQDRSFYSFAENASGDLWIGGNSGHAGGNTLLHRAPGASGFTTVPLSSAKGASTVNSLAFGKDGTLYVATMAHGLHRLVETAGVVRAQAVSLPGGIPTEQVNQLVLDGAGRLWAAGMRGLAVLDDRGWHRLGKMDGLRETEIETITAARSNGVWVTYWNIDGLTRLQMGDGDRWKATQVTGPAALAADTIYTGGLDAYGQLWLGTAMGVKRWNGQGVERFGRAQGLPGEDAAANAFRADGNGNLWFGMANGLARFDATNAPKLATPPVSRVTALQDGKGRVLGNAVTHVAWADRALDFHFAALSFIDEGSIQRQVRLLGFEDAWRDTDVSQARYTGLLPGRYVFQARARYGAGAYGPAGSRSVTILPPWWLTWWFIALAVIAAVSLLTVAYRWQLRRLKRRNLQLEALVALRTQDLQVANERLEEASMVDPLTGLKNRRYLKAFMPEELAHTLRQQRMHPPDAAGSHDHNIDLCVMLVDLDHFKAVNDEHGHGAGDAVLRQVGGLLRAACRASDVVVRWGGEEFLILARNTDRHQASVLAAQVCEAVRSHALELGDGGVLRKTCSLGFTAFPLLPGDPEKFDWEQAVELADQCLYAAKHSGRDGWVGCLLQAGMTPGVAAQAVAAEHPDAMRAIAGYGPAMVFGSFPPGTGIHWEA